ncbi:MAG: DUF3418 domain-containing protein, partial [Kiritimatiellia bacterium]
EAATAKHRAGLRRLFALQIKDALKYLEKNIPDLQKMAVAYMQVGKSEGGKDASGGGTLEELREQIIAVALERAFLLEPLPTDEFAFKRRLEEGRGRLTRRLTSILRLTRPTLANAQPASQRDAPTVFERRRHGAARIPRA